MSILRVNSITPYTGSLLTVNGDILITGNFTGSSIGNVGTRLSNLESETIALESFTSSFSTSVNNRLDSVQAYTASVSTSVGVLQSTASLYVPFSTSVDSRLAVVEATASLYVPLSSSVNSRLGSIEAETASLQISTNALNSVTASYATTGSNVFIGNQTISGSTVITGNLNIFGSSSFTTVTSSVILGGNTIQLNTFSPAVRFGGMSVIDSGSSGLTGSLLWDSERDKWIYSNPSGGAYDSAMLISGPKNTSGLGNELGLVNNYIIKAVGDDHISSSQMQDDGVTVTIPYTASIGNIVGLGSPTVFSTSVDSRLASLATTGSNTFVGNQTITGSILVNGSINANSLTGSIDYNNLTNIPAVIVSEGIVSGSSQITYSGITGIPTGIVSGSNQLTSSYDGRYVLSGSITQTTWDNIASKPDGIVSGSSQITISSTTGYTDYSSSVATSISASSAAATAAATWASLSGKPDGIVSGSSQVNADSITNFDENVLAYNNSLAVVSGSASNVKTFLSLGNVTNESKATMFTSPDFTGIPVAPTAAANTNSTQIATTAYVQQELTDLIGGASAAFDTLIEISASLAAGDSTLNTLVDGKLSKASNLSDLTDTSAARTNLGLAIGTNVQAYNSTLAAVAGGTYSGDDSITTIGTVTAGSVTAILPTGVVSSSAQITASVFGAVSGDVTIGSTGVATIGANSVALGTDTTGNYMSGVSAGNAGIVISHTPAEGSSATISLVGGVVSGSAQIDVASTTGDIALGTRTSGNYVASMTAGTGITVGTATGEGSTPVITNTGVTSIVAGNAITISGGTGAVTINHTDTSTAANLTTSARRYVSALTFDTYGHVTGYETGTETVTDTNTVTTNIAGTGVSVSAGTGNSTISIGQAVATSSNVQFNSLGVGKAASGTAGRIEATQDIVAYSSSDRRLKENINNIENPIGKILKINGVEFDWKEEHYKIHGYIGNDVGVIAQDLKDVLPQALRINDTGYYAVRYEKIIPLLIECIKELNNEITLLKSK